MGKTEHRFDIAIVGAGAVGGCLAYALSRAGFSIAMIEKTAVSAEQQPSFDERHLGFSLSTMVALDGLGLWQAMSEKAVSVSRIHVSSKGQFGSVLMDAKDEGLESLGYVMPAREIGRVLHEAIAREDNIQVFAPAQLISASISESCATIELAQDDELTNLSVDLLIGADGAESQVRELFHIGTSRWEYAQSAVIANLDVESLQSDLAYERFIDEGAIALLPRNETGYAAVCSVEDGKADHLMTMDDDAFSNYVQQHLGSRLARITAVGQRYRFPLALVRAKEAVRERLVLVGNAAHYIHPVAAQGFNLSMRDVTALVEVLIKAKVNGKQPGDLQTLQEYVRWRKQDEQIMVVFTDAMIRLFANPLLPIALLRQSGVLALRYIPPLRGLFTRAVTGRLGRQSALMRGAVLQELNNGR